MVPVLGSQPAVDVSHKPDGRLPLLSARPTVTAATLGCRIGSEMGIKYEINRDGQLFDGNRTERE